MNPQIIEPAQLTGLLPERLKDSHKSQFGTVTVIGGATGMIGAALLAGRAALKLGAGCVHVILLADDAPAVDILQPELMLHRAGLGIPASDYSIRGRTAAGIQFNEHAVLVVGCGMGRDTLAKQYLTEALHSSASLVLDADALNLLALHSELRELLTARKASTVLTPHPGEAARLLDCSTASIQGDRIAAIQKLATRFACSIALKGANSLCATRDGQLFVNRTGNPGMSAPGMGDVLAGMIAALIAQGMNADSALLLAVYLHGAAGDELAKQGIAIGMTATEVTDQARRLLNK